MIDVNTTAAALQNAAGIQNLMNPQANQDINKMALANTFQRGNMLLQNQLEAQRQAALLSAESQRQQAEIKAQAGLESVRQSGESTRQGAALTAQATLSQKALAAEATRQAAEISGSRATQLAVEGKREQSEIDLRNTAEAERIRADPLTPQLGIDMTKYDPRKPEDNAKLVADYQSAKTPDAMRKIYVDQASRLTDSLNTAKTQLASAANSPEGQRSQVMNLLGNPDVVNALLQSHNTSPTLGSFTRLSQQDIGAVRNQAMTDPAAALAQMNTWMNAASKGAVLGTNNQDIGAAFIKARQDAISATLSPDTAPPGIRQLYTTAADLGALRNNAIGQLGQYSPSPQDLQKATGQTPGGPITQMLQDRGAGAPTSSAGVQSTQPPPLPPLPNSPSSAGLTGGAKNYVDSQNQARSQAAFQQVTDATTSIKQKLDQLDQQSQSIASGPEISSPTLMGNPYAGGSAAGASKMDMLNDISQQRQQLQQQLQTIQGHQQALLKQGAATAAAAYVSPYTASDPGATNTSFDWNKPASAYATPTQTGQNPYAQAGSDALMGAAYSPPQNQ